MYNIKTIVEIIEKTAKINNLTISKLLSKSNLDKSVISRMKTRGQMIAADKLAMIADELNCSVDYLLGRTEIPEINGALSSHKKTVVDVNTVKPKKLDKPYIKPLTATSKNKKAPQPSIPVEETSEEEPKNIKNIPLSYLKASAGTGFYLFDDYDMTECETIPIDADAFLTAVQAIRITGDSMMPKYKNGDIVLINDQKNLENGDIGIFVVNGESYIKKYHIDDNGVRTLVSLNPKYKPIKFRLGDNARIVGRVLCTL